MYKFAAPVTGALLLAFVAGCGTNAPGDSPSDATGGARAGSGGRSGSGGSSSGSGGSSSGSGGSSSGSGGVGSGGTAASGGSSGSGGGAASGGQSGEGGGSAADAADETGAPSDSGTPPAPSDGGGAGPGPSAPGQGPVAGGKIVFSQDFEQNMNGTSRSPTNLPADRITIVDDPLKARGKVVKIEYRAGDDFRTSAGTQPRSWLSSAMGYSAKAGTTVSVAFGFMTDNPSWGAHFGQIIRDGGPLWMLLLASDGSVASEVHRGSGGGKADEKILPMKWYDFRVDTTYAGGGAIKFFMNGKPFGTGTGDAGGNGRFDCGIYWYKGTKATRTAWISNISIGEL
jgi:hypothetical protein